MFTMKICILCMVATFDAVFAAEGSGNDDLTLCTNQTNAIHEASEYQAVYDLVVDGLDTISSNCTPEDGFYQCKGALPDETVANMTETCEDLEGQIYELVNVRLTCRIGDNDTHVVVDMIPECVGFDCSKDEVGEFKDDYLGDLEDAAEPLPGQSYCVINEGESGSAPLSFAGATVLFLLALLPAGMI